jgi:hypothetical protein
MSSDFTAPLRSYLSNANDYTNEIHDVFNQHWEILSKDRQECIDRIDKWRHHWREHINKYANEQKVLINDHYNRLRPIFEEKYRNNLETANAYYAAQQLDLFNDLREACRFLEFQIATLNYSKEEMKQPQVIIVEKQLKTKNLEEKDDARRRRRRFKENGNKMESTSGISASSSSNPVTSNSKQTECVCVLNSLFIIVPSILIFSDRQSSEIKSERKNGQSIDNTDDSKNQVMNDDQSNNKCPICFMIFPFNMKRDNRQQHVNEHYTDD